MWSETSIYAAARLQEVSLCIFSLVAGAFISDRLKCSFCRKMGRKTSLIRHEPPNNVDGPGTSGRSYTVTLAVPGSLIDNTQNIEFATFVAGQVTAAQELEHICSSCHTRLKRSSSSSSNGRSHLANCIIVL